MNALDVRRASTEIVSLFQKEFGSAAPDVVVILGSGLGGFADALEGPKSLPYFSIPHFPKPTVPGHKGECVVGRIEGRSVLIFRGRFHYYEGHTLQLSTLPVRIAARWGIRTIVVSNASGAIRKDLHPGLLLIRDHLNLMGENPLCGENLDDFGPRFPDMSEAYDRDYLSLAKEIGKKNRIPLPEGVYAALSGPTYETPAEIKMLSAMGADVVGMSTVPEVIVAKHSGMRVLGISCITNYAAGVLGYASEPITHDEVLENTKHSATAFNTLLKSWIATFEE